MAVTDPRDHLDPRYENAQIVRLAEGPTALALHHEAAPFQEAAEDGAIGDTQGLGVEDVGGGR